MISEKVREAGVTLSRKELLFVIDKAEQTQAMLTFIQQNTGKLAEAGADPLELRSMRLQDFTSRVFFVLPQKAMSVVTGWLAESSRPVLDKKMAQWLSDSGEGKDKEDFIGMRLAEYLMPLRMNYEGLSGPPPEFRERACCMLAAMEDDRHKDFAAAATQVVSKGGNIDFAKFYNTLRSMAEEASTDVEHSNGDAFAESDSHIEMVFRCAVSIRAKDKERARSLLKVVDKLDKAAPEHDRMHAKLRGFYQEMIPEVRVSSSRVGPWQGRVVGNIDEVDVLALCNKNSPNPDNPGHSFAFSMPLAIRDADSGEWLELDDAQRRELFPESGSVIHLAGKQFPPLPKHRGYAVWRVERQNLSREQQSRFGTRTRVARKVCPVHRILHLEHIASHQRNLARQWLRREDFYDEEAEGERVLRFEDDLYVHTTSSYANLIDENFTQALRAWRGLSIIELSDGSSYYVGNLPDEHEEYHLTPPAGTLGRMMRADPNCTASDHDHFTRVLSVLGENHALSQRIRHTEPDKVRMDEEMTARLAGLYELTGQFQDSVRELRSEKDKSANQQLGAAESEFKEAEAVQEKVNAVFEHRRATHKELEEQIEAMLKAMREWLRNLGKDESMYPLMLAFGSQLAIQDRLDAIEESIAQLKGK